MANCLVFTYHLYYRADKCQKWKVLTQPSPLPSVWPALDGCESKSFAHYDHEDEDDATWHSYQKGQLRVFWCAANWANDFCGTFCCWDPRIWTVIWSSLAIRIGPRSRALWLSLSLLACLHVSLSLSLSHSVTICVSVCVGDIGALMTSLSESFLWLPFTWLPAPKVATKVSSLFCVEYDLVVWLGRLFD